MAAAGSVTSGVGRKIATIQALERWDEAHAEVVAQAERRPARLDELLEEPSRGPEPHAEVEQPAAGGPLDEDAVPPDLAWGAAVHGDGQQRCYCASMRDTGWISFHCLWFFSCTKVPVIATCVPTGGIVVWSVNPAHAGFASRCVTL